jgi:epoxyqueuosine reductase
VTSADAFDDVAETIAARREAGLGGKLRFTYKDPETAADVRLSFPWAQRIVVVSWPYMPEGGNPGPMTPGTGRVARFATEDHYRGLKAALTEIQDALHDEGRRAEIVVDDDRLVDRAAAVRAGVAWWGKSTMVLDPRNGPWLLLGSVITDAELPTTDPMVRDCGTCVACIPACPTGAIVAPGVLDASLCLAHWTQMAGVIPRELREPMADRIYGCDDCLDACPPGIKRLADAPMGVGRVGLVDLLAADDAALREKYDHFYLPRRNPKFLRRNALIALGNTTADAIAADSLGPGEAQEIVAILAGYLGHADEIYRIHAAWAIGRIGGDGAQQLLSHQLKRERNDGVATEIAVCLGEIETGDMGGRPKGRSL